MICWQSRDVSLSLGSSPTWRLGASVGCEMLFKPKIHRRLAVSPIEPWCTPPEPANMGVVERRVAMKHQVSIFPIMLKV